MVVTYGVQAQTQFCERCIPIYLIDSWSICQPLVSSDNYSVIGSSIHLIAKKINRIDVNIRSSFRLDDGVDSAANAFRIIINCVSD